MVPQWKRWLGAAAVLLLVGAGCEAKVRQEAPAEAGADVTGETQDDGQAMVDAESSSDTEVTADAAVDAMLKEAEEDAMNEYEEGSDADVILNDKAELDAYGNAYDKSQL